MHRSLIDSLEIRRLLANIYVDLNAPSGGDGSSWNEAYRSLQSALSAADSGDDIRVANGTYKPTSGTSRGASFVMKDGVDLFGGYAGFGASNPDARDVAGNLTTLSGDIGQSGESDDNSFHVITAKGHEDSLTIDGFKISNGNAIGAPDERGGGAFVAGMRVTFNACRFLDNRAVEGGGIFQTDMEDQPEGNPDFFGLIVTKSHFERNDAVTGGAISMYTVLRDLLIDQSTFKDNYASESGSAISGIGNFQEQTRFLIKRSVFEQHTRGGNSVLNITSVWVIECTFDSNDETPVVGSDFTDIYVYYSTFTNNRGENGGAAANVTAIWSTFTDNSAAESGGALYNSDARYCTFTRNHATNGGAMAGRGDVRGSKFYANSATENGGAVNLDNWYTIENCEFVGNKAEVGGAIYGDAILPQDPENYPGNVIGSTFAENHDANGAAIYNHTGATIEVLNSIIWNSDSSPIDNNGTVLAANLIVKNGFTGTMISSSDPKFVQLPSSGTDQTWGTNDDITGDLNLQSNSPAIDAGNETFMYEETQWDLSNQLRVYGSTVDLGAYERQPAHQFYELDGGSITIYGTTGDDVIRSEWLFSKTRILFNNKVLIDDDSIHTLKIYGDDGNDLIELWYLEFDSVYLSGGDGNDTIEGTAGNDTISGGAQKDRLLGGQGNDRLGGNGGKDSLYGEEGSDRLYGNDSDDLLSGGPHVDWLYGGDGNDRLAGGKSNDKLYGQEGNDSLNGSTGNDLINGGAGTDTANQDANDSLVTQIEILV